MAEKSRVNELTLRDGAELDPELEVEGVDAALALELAVELDELPQAEMPAAAVNASAAKTVLLIRSCNYLLLLRSRKRTPARRAPPPSGCHSDNRVCGKP
jgi:hypothetical protein